MPRVLRIINRLNLGGPTYNAAYLTKYLAPEFETLLVAGMKDDSEESSEFIVESMGIKPVYISNMQREINFTNDLKAYKEISKIIKEFKPDIVHTHAAKAGTLGRIAACNNNVPVVIHTFHGHVFHSYFSPLKTKIFIGIERFLSSISTGIVAISEEQKKDLCETYSVCNKNKTHIIPLGFDLDRFSTNTESKRTDFRKKYKLDDDVIAVGIIGRLVPIKNHSLFINAWKEINNQYNSKVHAFIIGDGEDRQKLEEHCKELGIIFNTPEKQIEGASLTLTSWIKNIDWAMAGLDIIALTSFNEGTPVSLIEAQAAGKPIVSTDVGGLANAVIPELTALLSESDDLQTFTNNLKRLIDDKSLRKSLADHGPAFANTHFGFTRLVNDMQILYNQLLMDKK